MRLLGSTRNLLKSTHEILLTRLMRLLASRSMSTQLFTINKRNHVGSKPRYNSSTRHKSSQDPRQGSLKGGGSRRLARISKEAKARKKAQLEAIKEEE